MRSLLGRLALQVAVSAAFIAVLLWRVDASQLRADLAAADWRWLALGLLFLAASQALHGVRWWLLVRRGGVVPLWEGMLARVAITGVDLLLPFHAGYAVLAQILYRRYGVERATVLGTLVAEGVSVVITLVVLVAVLAPFVAVNTIASPLVLALAAAGLAVGGLVLWLAYRQGLFGLLERRMPASIRGALSHLAGQFASGFAELGSLSSVLLLLLGTLAEWAAAGLGLAAVGRGFGLDAALPVYFLAQIVSYLSFVVPVTQGNVGPYELALTGTLTAYGADGDRAAAFALGAHAVVLIATAATALPAGLALRLRRQDIFYFRAAQDQV